MLRRRWRWFGAAKIVYFTAGLPPDTQLWETQFATMLKHGLQCHDLELLAQQVLRNLSACTPLVAPEFSSMGLLAI